MDTQIKDIYKIYQLMEFFVVKHSYSNIMIKGLASKNEVWLANKDNPSFNIIRLSTSSLDETYTDKKRIDEYLKVISTAISRQPLFLDLHISNEECEDSEVFDTACVNTGFSSGLDLEPVYPGIRYVVHDVDNPESEIALRISSVNSSMKQQVKQRKQMRKLKLKFSITLIIIALCVLNFIVSLFLSYRSDQITAAIALGADYKFFTLGLGQFWRLITYAFCHNGLLHLALNMYSLFILGTYFERKYGSIKFIFLMLAGIIGGSLVNGALTGSVNNVALGMSTAIYSLFTIYIIEAISNGAYRDSRFVIMILINLGLNFMPNIAWQAHLGGALMGLLFYYMYKNEKIDIKICLLTVILLSCIGYKYFSIKDISPMYLGTDQQVCKLYDDIGLHSYANKLYDKIYNYYINLK